jgi:type I restriction enzyme M protein
MNLVMRGILPGNIVTRNADTLEDDWPYFDEQDPVNSYNPLYLDAVVSNPPYSQKWYPLHKEADPRYARFGVAPKSKADYAFLLHDLYHLKPNGIMAIVLPHGVLFRGGEEGVIRKQLIENDHLETIIGLPEKIFFGTGIATVILVLRQKREGSDVLFVDASKGFAKEGKNNKLRACDIKKITDVVVARATVPGFSRLVPKTELQGEANDYNLNIPRYVDSSEAPESWDLYASMFGGIPLSELDTLGDYWKAFPNLRATLFTLDGTPYAQPKVDDLAAAVSQHPEVTKFNEDFKRAFDGFKPWLHSELIGKMLTLQVPRQEALICDELFARLTKVGTEPLIDKYQAYQVLDDQWQPISVDLEVLQTEGFDASRVVDPNFVVKKKDGKEVEVQEGWKGRILPFELVQRTHFSAELDALRQSGLRLDEISATLGEIIESLSEADGEYSVLNGSNEKFAIAEVKNELKDQLGEIVTDEIKALQVYLDLVAASASKQDKLAFIAKHQEVNWEKIPANKDGTFGKSKVEARIVELQSEFDFADDAFATKLIRVLALLDEEKDLKDLQREQAAALHQKTKSTIESLSDGQVHELLASKWIAPMVDELHRLPRSVMDGVIGKLEALVQKYRITYADNARDIQRAEAALATMLGELHGGEFDLKGIEELKTLLVGN